MRAFALAALLAVPLVFAALSGCVDCATGPPVSARGITDADASAGLRGFTLEITVTDGPGGAPLEGAGVIVYYGRDEVGAWNGPRVEVGPDSVVVEPMNASGTPVSRTVLRMMTGPDGMAHARVPGNRIVGVVVAKADHTEEWLPAVAAGDSGSSGAIEVPLYRSRIVTEMEGVWGPGEASTGFATESQYAWDPHPAPLGEGDDAQRGYAARIVELRATLTWTNSLNGGGDLGIGIGPPEDGPRYFADDDENIGSGVQTETTTLNVEALRAHGILDAPRIQVGAATDSGFVAPFGLPYLLELEARFDTTRAAFASCLPSNAQDDNDGVGANVPVPGALFAALALAGAALWMGRAKAY